MAVIDIGGTDDNIDVTSPEYYVQQQQIVDALAKRGEELSQLNRPIKYNKHLHEFPQPLSEIAEKLKPALSQLYAHAISSGTLTTNPYAEELKLHISKLQASCATITKGTTRKRDDHTKIVLGFWKDIDEAIPLILKVMNRDEQEATTKQIDGKENKMLPNFRALIDAHNNIAKYMQSVGHKEFEPKYTKPVTKLNGKATLSISLAFLFATIGLAASWIKQIQSSDDYALDTLSSPIKTDYHNPNDPSEFSIENPNFSNLDPDNYYRLNSDNELTEISARAILSEANIQINGSEFTITQDDRQTRISNTQTFNMDEKNTVTSKAEPLKFSGKNYGKPFKIIFSPHPRNPEYLSISAKYIDGREFTGSEMDGLDYFRLQNLGSTYPKFELVEVSDGGTSELMALINFIGCIVSGALGLIYTHDNMKRVSIETVKNPERIDTHADRLLRAITGNERAEWNR